MLRHLLRGYSRAVLVDPKGRAVMDGWPTVYGVAAFRAAWPASPRVVARTGPGEDRRAWLDAVAWHVYRHGETAFGLDEVAGVVDASRGSRGLDAVLMQGRELGITAIVCSQRPRRIPPAIISEADHVIAFALAKADDRKAIAEVIGDYRSPPDRSFRFVYWSGDLTAPIESRPLVIGRSAGD